MTNFAGIQDIDYKWTNPKTYVVLVPVLSLIVQKVQLSNLLPLPKSDDQKKLDAASRKFCDVCKWHLRGSMVQTLAAIIAIKFYGKNAFAWLGALAAYEMADTAWKGLKNPGTIYEFYPNGSVKRQESANACNIF